jgi:hypothetical protein
MEAMEPPVSHRVVTTVMALLGDIQVDVRRIREVLEKRTMAKRKYQKLTDEDHARHERIQEMVRERIAYHEAKVLEEEQAAEEARKRGEGS